MATAPLNFFTSSLDELGVSDEGLLDVTVSTVYVGLTRLLSAKRHNNVSRVLGVRVLRLANHERAESIGNPCSAGRPCDSRLGFFFNYRGLTTNNHDHEQTDSIWSYVHCAVNSIQQQHRREHHLRSPVHIVETA